MGVKTSIQARWRSRNFYAFTDRQPDEEKWNDRRGAVFNAAPSRLTNDVL